MKRKMTKNSTIELETHTTNVSTTEKYKWLGSDPKDTELKLHSRFEKKNIHANSPEKKAPCDWKTKIRGAIYEMQTHQHNVQSTSWKENEKEVSTSTKNIPRGEKYFESVLVCQANVPRNPFSAIVRYTTMTPGFSRRVSRFHSRWRPTLIKVAGRKGKKGEEIFASGRSRELPREVRNRRDRWHRCPSTMGIRHDRGSALDAATRSQSHVYRAKNY